MKRKLAFYWLIVFVTMTTAISSHVKDKNDTFTARGEDMIFLVKGEILVFHQYLYNKSFYIRKLANIITKWNAFQSKPRIGTVIISSPISTNTASIISAQTAAIMSSARAAIQAMIGGEK